MKHLSRAIHELIDSWILAESRQTLLPWCYEFDRAATPKAIVKVRHNPLVRLHHMCFLHKHDLYLTAKGEVDRSFPTQEKQ